MSYEVLVGRTKELARVKEHINGLKRNVREARLGTGTHVLLLKNLQDDEMAAFIGWLKAVGQRHEAILQVLNHKIAELDAQAGRVIEEVIGK